MNFMFNTSSLIAAIFLFHQVFTDFTDRPCPEESENQVIMFTDEDDFKKSKAPFIEGKDGFEGNHVVFARLKKKTLEKKSFICETCEFIVKLVIRAHNLEEIGDGAFENLRCLKNLDMSRNNLMEITPETFAELQKLEMLALTHNKLHVLKNNTFAKNRHLKELHLTLNEIHHIEELAFHNLLSLERLLLDSNKMSIINFEIFRNLPKLKGLDLAYNVINTIEATKAPFSNSIESIDVSYNQLTEGMENIYLPNIVKIKFTHNRLKKLDVKALKSNCPKLEYIEIFDNFWECQELSNITDSLQKAKIRYGKPINCIQKIKDDSSSFKFYLLIIIQGLLYAAAIFIIILVFCGIPYIVLTKRRQIHYFRGQVGLEPAEQNEAIELEPMEENEPDVPQEPQPVVRLRRMTENEETELYM